MVALHLIYCWDALKNDKLIFVLLCESSLSSELQTLLLFVFLSVTFLL